jgi:hypothetical protein
MNAVRTDSLRQVNSIIDDEPHSTLLRNRNRVSGLVIKLDRRQLLFTKLNKCSSATAKQLHLLRM